MESLYFAVAEFIKRNNPTQVFSCEYCELFINTFFEDIYEQLLLIILLQNGGTNVVNQFQASAPFLYPLFSGGAGMEKWHQTG